MRWSLYLMTEGKNNMYWSFKINLETPVLILTNEAVSFEQETVNKQLDRRGPKPKRRRDPHDWVEF